MGAPKVSAWAQISKVYPHERSKSLLQLSFKRYQKYHKTGSFLIFACKFVWNYSVILKAKRTNLALLIQINYFSLEFYPNSPKLTYLSIRKVRHRCKRASKWLLLCILPFTWTWLLVVAQQNGLFSSNLRILHDISSSLKYYKTHIFIGLVLPFFAV